MSRERAYREVNVLRLSYTINTTEPPACLSSARFTLFSQERGSLFLSLSPIPLPKNFRDTAMMTIRAKKKKQHYFYFPFYLINERCFIKASQSDAYRFILYFYR